MCLSEKCIFSFSKSWATAEYVKELMSSTCHVGALIGESYNIVHTGINVMKRKPLLQQLAIVSVRKKA